MDEMWRKSGYSFSNGNCVEARWRKSSRSHANGNCAEARASGGMVQVRDSKLGDASPVLSFAQGDWSAFVAGVKGAGPG